MEIPDPTETPSGMPEEAVSEPAPLGTPDPDEDAPATGEDAMPGIASDGDPPDAG